MALHEEIHNLADGSKLIFIRGFLPPDAAQQYFEELRITAPWEQKPGVFGHLQPRLTASFGDEGLTYRYSGTVNQANPWTPTLLSIKERIEAIIPRFEQPTVFNYCLLNRYRDGKDSVGMHADDELGMDNVIGSLSLGATRTFKIRRNKSKDKMEFEASNGSLIIMGGTMQTFWKHGVDKEPEVEGERINLTFKRMEG
jgi:alkylated DNA repair dioxygenase AlkB